MKMILNVDEAQKVLTEHYRDRLGFPMNVEVIAPTPVSVGQKSPAGFFGMITTLRNYKANGEPIRAIKYLRTWAVENGYTLPGLYESKVFVETL